MFDCVLVLLPFINLWRPQVLKPLTKLTDKGLLCWDNLHQEPFDIMKSVIAADAINHYADPNKSDDIYTNSSDHQMVACIIQEGKHITYWSQSLTNAQKNYNTIEKELLAVVTVSWSTITFSTVQFLNVLPIIKSNFLKPYTISKYVAGNSGLKTTMLRFHT